MAVAKKYNIGMMVDFKLKAGRGRPACGKIIEFGKGAVQNVIVENYEKKIIRVPVARIVGDHVVRYQKRAAVVKVESDA